MPDLNCRRARLASRSIPVFPQRVNGQNKDCNVQGFSRFLFECEDFCESSLRRASKWLQREAGYTRGWTMVEKKLRSRLSRDYSTAKKLWHARMSPRETARSAREIRENCSAVEGEGDAMICLQSILYLLKRYLRFGRKALRYGTISRTRARECLLRDYLRYPPEFVRTNGFYIYLNPSDLMISYSIFATGGWEPRTTLLLQRLLSKTSVVVDIGANIGWFTLCSAKRATQVHAFEPDSKSLELLRRSIASNGFHNVRLYPHAVGEREGMARLFLADGSNKGAHSLVRQVGTRELVVPVDTLDTVFATKTIDILKIDVE